MEETERPSQIATMCKALGDPTRLRIFEFICDCCCRVALDSSGDVRPVVGPTVGEVCCRVTGEDRATSRISFHLKELRQAGLITMERRGKYILCGVAPEAIEMLVGYLEARRSGEKSETCCE